MRGQKQMLHIRNKFTNSGGKIKAAMIFLVVCVLLLLSVCTVAAADNRKKVDKSNYAYIGGDYSGIDHAAKSVFYVEIYDSHYSPMGSGSGFVMFDEGLFVTNQHVINEASYLIIMDDDGKEYILDQVVVSDAEHDIAILLFPEAKYTYDSLVYDTGFDQLKRGQAVLAIGSPQGLPGTVSDGIISAFPKFQNEDTRYIQITAPISPGSSGGCLLNEDLEVIGVTSSGYETGENIGFAIPVFIVEQLYSQWNKRDTISLGTQSSWDTVGYGIHSRISGAKGKPQIQDSSSGNTGSTQTQPSAKLGVNLDVTWDSGKNLYALTINGKTLSWDQTVDSATKFCIQNGIRMTHFYNDVNEDAYSETYQRIVFGGNLDVCDNGFYVRKGANTTDLNQIDIVIKNNMTDLNEVIKCATDTYQKLQRKFGSPTRDMVIYANGKSIEVKTNDLTKAIKQMSQQNGSYSTLSIRFNNLSFYIGYNLFDEGRSYEVEMSVTPW